MDDSRPGWVAAAVVAVLTLALAIWFAATDDVGFGLGFAVLAAVWGVFAARRRNGRALRAEE